MIYPEIFVITKNKNEFYNVFQRFFHVKTIIVTKRFKYYGFTRKNVNNSDEQHGACGPFLELTLEEIQ